MNIIQHIAAMTARPCCNAHEQNSAIQHTNSYETWICLFDAWRKVTTYFPKRCFFWWSSMLECKKQHKQNIQIQGNVSISWVHFYCNIPHLPAFWPQPIKNQWAVDFEKNKKKTSPSLGVPWPRTVKVTNSSCRSFGEAFGEARTSEGPCREVTGRGRLWYPSCLNTPVVERFKRALGPNKYPRWFKVY